MTEIQSLARGLKILDLLGQASDGISITELAETLKVDKGSASRLASTLARYGYAEKDEVTRRYHLGPQVVGLSRSVLTRLPLREAAKPYLRQLMERTGECAASGRPRAGQSPLHRSGRIAGYAACQCRSRDDESAALHRPRQSTDRFWRCRNSPSRLERFTSRTIKSQRALQEHLEEIRRVGYAVDDEEFDPACAVLPCRCLTSAEKRSGRSGFPVQPRASPMSGFLSWPRLSSRLDRRCQSA